MCSPTSQSSPKRCWFILFSLPKGESRQGKVWKLWGMFPEETFCENNRLCRMHMCLSDSFDESLFDFSETIEVFNLESFFSNSTNRFDQSECSTSRKQLASLHEALCSDLWTRTMKFPFKCWWVPANSMNAIWFDIHARTCMTELSDSAECKLCLQVRRMGRERFRTGRASQLKSTTGFRWILAPPFASTAHLNQQCSH